MVVTDDILTQRFFDVLASLTPEEKREWAQMLIAWANEKQEAQP